MLDAIICPEWLDRYYSFNAKWSPGEQMASMRNGSGDGYFVLFNKHGAILKGYAHESAAAEWRLEHGKPLPGMFDGIPPAFERFLTEPAFSIDETTFCFWREFRDQTWNCGTPRYPDESDGGAAEFLAILQGDANSYARWASDYFERSIDASAVRRVFRHERLSAELVQSINSQISVERLRPDIEEIGYGNDVNSPSVDH
ncbi:MAG TPA: hypothetical protein VFC46_01930 [Humisphaera sp.]|nr:hypothetical protein [Humisphaera sp.]